MSERIICCAVLTISDRCSEDEKLDQSGPVVAAALSARAWHVDYQEILPDDVEQIAERIAVLADSGISLILTTGGTGLGPRDRTPEATLRVADRQVPGLCEKARAQTGRDFPRAYLSRGIAAMRGRCLILNLPGSVRGARETFEAIAELIPHALEVIGEEPGRRGAHDSKPERGTSGGRS